MSPAEEAKAYAVEHGYRIEVNGRRYDVWMDYEGFNLPNHVANVGGYPAALNAMKRHVEAQNIASHVPRESQMTCAVDVAMEGADHSATWEIKLDPTPRPEHSFDKFIDQMHRDLAKVVGVRPEQLTGSVAHTLEDAREFTETIHRQPAIDSRSGWCVMFNGEEASVLYPSRDRALLELRRAFNAARGEWLRKQTWTIEYRRGAA